MFQKFLCVGFISPGKKFKSFLEKVFFWKMLNNILNVHLQNLAGFDNSLNRIEVKTGLETNTPWLF